jgi:spore coat polysaccharide biosynthesis protein SpsF (cytidylyltransferase family)
MEFYRGSESDVLDRYYRAAKSVDAIHIARITSDCPLVDPKVIDRVADEYFKKECDYISTGRMVSSYPDGLDTEIFSFAALEHAWKDAKLPSEREHVTPYIWNHPELFKIETVNYERDLSGLRWTVDEPRDLEFVRRVYREIGEHMFYMEDVLKLLEQQPEIGAINSDIVRNSGYYKSLRQEEK